MIQRTYRRKAKAKANVPRVSKRWNSLLVVLLHQVCVIAQCSAEISYPSECSGRIVVLPPVPLDFAKMLENIQQELKQQKADFQQQLNDHTEKFVQQGEEIESDKKRFE